MVCTSGRIDARLSTPTSSAAVAILAAACRSPRAVPTSAAFSRRGVHEGQQFILRRLWAEDGLTRGEIARRLGLARLRA